MRKALFWVSNRGIWYILCPMAGHSYFLHHAFVINSNYRKATVDIETNSIQKLLEEVVELDLAGDPET